jgi:hypothetical protein
MYALKVQVNSENPIVAGAPDLGVLNAIINCVGPLGEAARKARDSEETDLFLSVGGLTSRLHDLPDEHLRWASNRSLQVGDIVRVEIVETDSADPPEDAREAEKRQQDEREYFEHCKKVYLELREKYEV